MVLTCYNTRVPGTVTDACTRSDALSFFSPTVPYILYDVYEYEYMYGTCITVIVKTMQ